MLRNPPSQSRWMAQLPREAGMVPAAGICPGGSLRTSQEPEQPGTAERLTSIRGRVP